MNIKDIEQIDPITAVKLAKLARDNDTTIEELCEELLERRANTLKRKAYNINEVADILGVTRRTVYNYISSGGLKAFKVGNRWRVSDISLDSLFLTGLKPGTKTGKAKGTVMDTFEEELDDKHLLREH